MRAFAVILALALAAPLCAQTANFRATLSWVDNSNNEDGFRIERSPNVTPRAWSSLGTVATDVVSFVDEPLNEGDDFCWRIVAFNAVGDANPSGEACAAAPTRPAPAGGLTVIITQVP